MYIVFQIMIQGNGLQDRDLYVGSLLGSALSTRERVREKTGQRKEVEL